MANEGDIALLREWWDASCKDNDDTDTRVDYLADHFLGEEVECPYCCGKGDGHWEARGRDLDWAIEASINTGKLEDPFTDEIRTSMRNDLAHWASHKTA